ncbi:hypothetical protein CPB86DRAFT_791086 [Serendipita vermifera]|nr:hypothetical protein CPB86DRAFT_791086 [Serendipita vermifera]
MIVHFISAFKPTVLDQFNYRIDCSTSHIRILITQLIRNGIDHLLSNVFWTGIIW